MPTIITHAAVPLALGVGLGRSRIPGRLLVVGVIASMLPDLDVLGFRLGISYDSLLSHRGVTHSLFFAAMAAVYVAYSSRLLKVNAWAAGFFVFVCMASHALLDMLTTGGQGIALLWPWSDERIFFPYRVIQVSPFNQAAFFSQRGLDVIVSELAWVWFPCLVVMMALALPRLRERKRQLERIHAAQRGQKPE